MASNEKRSKIKKGFLAVRVGLEEYEEDHFKRFTIPIAYLHHPLFKSLLETSREVYGYSSSGPLKLPCSVDDFLHVRWLIERQSSRNLHQGSFSLYSCWRFCEEEGGVGGCFGHFGSGGVRLLFFLFFQHEILYSSTIPWVFSVSQVSEPSPY